ncbi:MAG: hypothetical protein HY554_06365 [Elusimicrobia bacterium]|nr:hypothetical protein [Elusimicrobiota bacterium]
MRDDEFFGDRPALRALGRLARARLGSREPGSVARVWLPAFGDGRALYAVAIALREALLGAKQRPRFIASDPDPAVLEQARRGVYRLPPIGSARLRSNFVPTPGGHRLAAELRGTCLFIQHDLWRDAPFTRLDVVAYRRGLATLDADRREAALRAFHYALAPGGILMLAPGDALGADVGGFEAVTEGAGLYSRTGAPFHLSAPWARWLPLLPEAEKLRRGRGARAAVLLRGDLAVLKLSGDAGQFLARPVVPGEALLRALHPGLRDPVFSLLAKLGQEAREREVEQVVAFARAGRLERLRLRAASFALPQSPGRQLWLFVDDAEPAPSGAGPPGTEEPGFDAILRDLERSAERAAAKVAEYRRLLSRSAGRPPNGPSST